MNSILIVSKEQEVFQAFKSSLRSVATIAKASTMDAALAMLQKNRYDLISIDLEILRKSGNDYKTSFNQFWHLFPTIEIIVMSSPEMIREAVKAVKIGASNYLTYPVTSAELMLIIESIHESEATHSELDFLREHFWQSDALETVKTKSSAMRNVLEKIRSVAPTKSTVLLLGETGTGKSLLANLIHRHSNRKHGPFISVHCAAIPETLLESELFGHEKGAYTGAERRKLGKFEIANEGTIFLDEIGTITPTTQIKLLQILQDTSFQRLGAQEIISVNVRIIAATNTDLKKLSEEGQFRKDLFYRLNVFPIELPSLVDRVEDIPHLAKVILEKINKFNTKEIFDVHPSVMEAFQRYSWPGNIRELENLIERAYILESSSVLTPESFPIELFESEAPSASIKTDASLALAYVRQQGIEDIERLYLKNLLADKKGKIKDSATVAEISTRQLHKLMKKHGLRKEDFK